MKAVVQRVKNASISVEGAIVGAIDAGLLVYLGVGKDDAEADADWLAEKICGLRIFEDADEKMNLSVIDTGGGVLSVSQFTLLADARKGKRPSYGDAAPPAMAEALYERFKASVARIARRSASGVFGASMEVSYVNMGPVTILLDTKKP
ncbi:MAG: D-tyrosyl-tRNA(Tyr) deacylase [Spirochaetes bacterium]|nr:D-tyrosyl-tRNA(Tyr) deacylase [Spirochaetota bacterium]MBU1082196.1 D-tyrosyl-tRNA(Tyr) deacylase [Spirochaetota bacterium]